MTTVGFLGLGIMGPPMAGASTTSTPEVGGYGVDHIKVAAGLGGKAIRVHQPDDLLPAFEKARTIMAENRVSVVVEVLLERVTTISRAPSWTMSPSSRSWPPGASRRPPRSRCWIREDIR